MVMRGADDGFVAVLATSLMLSHVRVAYGHGWVLSRRGCDMLSTSGLVDDDKSAHGPVQATRKRAYTQSDSPGGTTYMTSQHNPAQSDPPWSGQTRSGAVSAVYDCIGVAAWRSG